MAPQPITTTFILWNKEDLQIEYTNRSYWEMDFPDWKFLMTEYARLYCPSDYEWREYIESLDKTGIDPPASPEGHKIQQRRHWESPRYTPKRKK